MRKASKRRTATDTESYAFSFYMATEGTTAAPVNMSATPFLNRFTTDRENHKSLHKRISDTYMSRDVLPEKEGEANQSTDAIHL